MHNLVRGLNDILHQFGIMLIVFGFSFILKQHKYYVFMYTMYLCIYIYVHIGTCFEIIGSMSAFYRKYILYMYECF